MTGRRAEKNQTLARVLADYTTELAFADLPAEVVQMARLCLMDAIGCGLYGCTTDEGSRAAAAVNDYDGGGRSAVWGTTLRLSSPAAAFANGTAAHARELDDWNADIHAGAVIVPAVLAVAEAKNCSGKDVILATVVGYEIGNRISRGMGSVTMRTRGWMPSGPIGAFCAAAAVGKLLGLDAEQVTWALGLAGSYTGGIWAFVTDGAMSKRFMCGKAAETGVIAAFLARRGFTGPAAILEAPFGGFFKTYMTTENHPGAVTEQLGSDFAILQTGFKPYASCLGVHPIIEAALELRNGGLSTEDIGHIRVITNPQTKLQGSSSDIRTVLDAQLSVVYGVAVSLATGDASIRAYSAERISDPLVHHLMSSVEVLADHTFKGTDAVVEVATRGGHILRAVACTPKGYPQNPMTEPQLIEKFRSLAAYRLMPREIEQTIQRLARVESLSDINDLSEPLRGLPS